MPKIRRDNLYKPLKRSRLVSNMDDHEEYVHIPKKYVINKVKTIQVLDIKNDNDFYEIMEKLRWFGVDKLPHEIYRYVYDNNPDLSNFEDFFYNELSLLLTIEVKSSCTERIIKQKNRDLFDLAVDTRSLNLVKFLGSIYIMPGRHAFRNAIRNGDLDIIKYMVEELNQSVNYYFDLKHTCEFNRFEIFKYLYGIFENDKNLSLPEKKDYKIRVYLFVAEYGSLDILKYLHVQKKLPVHDGILPTAIENHHINVTKYCIENQFPGYKDFKLLKYGVKTNDSEFVLYLHNHYVQYGKDYSALDQAVREGNFKIIKILVENDYPHNANTFSQAVLLNNLEIVKYLHEKGVQWDSYATVNACKIKDIEILKYLVKNGCQHNCIDWMVNSTKKNPKGSLFREYIKTLPNDQ